MLIYVPGLVTLYFLPGTMRETNTVCTHPRDATTEAWKERPEAIQLGNVEVAIQTQIQESSITSFIYPFDTF